MESLTCILKYVIIGDSSVGKSSILIRLTDDRFVDGGTEPTLGVEFGSRVLSVGEQGRRVKVQCWDTAGTESFRSITRSYFRGAAGALLVYDVTWRETFEHATTWLNDLRQHADENVSIILVANKTDLVEQTPPTPADSPSDPAAPGPSAQSTRHGGDTGNKNNNRDKSSKSKGKARAISTAEGERFAAQHGLMYVETSAKEGWGIVDAFERTAGEVLSRLDREEAEARLAGRGKAGKRGGQNGIRLGADGSEARGGCC